MEIITEECILTLHMKVQLKQLSRNVMDAMADGGAKLKRSTLYAAKAIDRHHEQIADHADTLAKASKVAGTVAVAGAFVAAPTGLTAAGVALGLVSAPLIVSIAPAIAVVAGGAAALSAGASLYSKARRKRQSESAMPTQESCGDSAVAKPADNAKLPE